MKKIPTLFERDWQGDKSRVIDQPNEACAWVFAGEGHATVKLDGTCVLLRDGKRFKRREISEAAAPPEGFEPADYDILGSRIVGWVPVSDGPEDRWHRDALGSSVDGTYELVGPKVQSNPECLDQHILVPHGSILPESEPPRDFYGLRGWLMCHPMEGVVFHHPDGRMAKIKRRDFGLEWPIKRLKDDTAPGNLADAIPKKAPTP